MFRTIYLSKLSLRTKRMNIKLLARILCFVKQSHVYSTVQNMFLVMFFLVWDCFVVQMITFQIQIVQHSAQ